MNQLPTTGRFRLQYRGTECLNCGHPLDLSDRFCPNCSQANSTKKISVRDYWEEFMSGYIAYDSRLLRTLSAMLFKPGKITREFVEGRRMRYTNPFRFLLSLSILYFLLVNTQTDFEGFNQWGDGFKLPAATQDSIARKEGVPENVGIPSTLNISKWEAEKDSLLLSKPDSVYQVAERLPFWDRTAKKFGLFYAMTRKEKVYAYKQVVQRHQFPDTFENKATFRMARSTYKASLSPGSFLQSFLSSLPFATFFFLPVFTCFLWLMYIRKKVTYTDNLVFSFHNQSVLFILLIVSFLTDAITGLDTAWIAFLLFAIYLYKAMRYFYRQGRLKTILKYLILNTVFVILSGIGALLLLVGSAFTY